MVKVCHIIVVSHAREFNDMSHDKKYVFADGGGG
jgi:hypothetical protein